jgi:quercetin dioxygenase-like cupin family protein
MASAASSPKLERDPVTLDPKHYKVEVENEQMRVVRIKYRAHEKSPMHQHPRGVCVFLTDSHFKFTYPDGKTEEFRKKAGEFMAFTEPWEHQPENLNGKDFEAVYVEIRK